jgi:hypothetical protein
MFTWELFSKQLSCQLVSFQCPLQVQIQGSLPAIKYPVRPLEGLDVFKEDDGRQKLEQHFLKKHLNTNSWIIEIPNIWKVIIHSMVPVTTNQIHFTKQHWRGIERKPAGENVMVLTCLYFTTVYRYSIVNYRNFLKSTSWKNQHFFRQQKKILR